ncbi:hemolysin secretion protein D [Veronia nyctiphanis]|uniref:Membrane fusion protein (MFP) family protein n=1 Tax=Veronia nyctiphanis TaxID=1278244 RepID=A0A4Q0YT09_9GAMM|nr:HlyD family type I secretion periplasmic adaptor subunit [Veronia nyctiphanis]RXJ73823.1 hemolysin secretion protein D [Veronia nyctiphanis]
MKRKYAKDIEMADDIYGAILSTSPVQYRIVIWGVFAFFVVMLIWAHFASLDQVTRGSGKVIPSSKIQTIQSLDGGVLEEMLVREGDAVKKGQVVAVIDDTRVQSDLAQQDEEKDSLQANITRINFELDSIVIADKKGGGRDISISITEVVFNEALVKEQPKLVARQQQEYESRLKQLKTKLAISDKQIKQKRIQIREVDTKLKTLTKSLKSIREEIAIAEPMVKRGIEPEINQIQRKRQESDISGEIQTMKLQKPRLIAAIEEAEITRIEHAQTFISAARAELDESETRLARIVEARVGTSDKVNRALVRAPVTGKVKTIYFNTEGGVVRPGEDVMEIVPSEDKLLVEAKINPKDIAFLRPGLEAVVKVTAYDFTRYGGLTGTLDHISADTTTDEEGNSFYIVRISTDASAFKRKTSESSNNNMQIIPGMTTSVDIITGKRTVLEYLLNPILRAKESALRER